MGQDVTVRLGDRDYRPQEISAIILKALKERAETQLGQTVTKAVITVPAYFNDAQRQATREAGEIAGLEVVRILNEPTAASLAYDPIRAAEVRASSSTISAAARSTCRCSRSAKNGVVEVLGPHGDTHLGGDDFDERLVSLLCDRFNAHGVDLTKDKMALQRLREAAEKAKIELSSSMQTSINLPYITASADGPLHLDESLSRAQFEKPATCSTTAKAPFAAVIKDAGVSLGDIHHIVMVGGSTRMPAVTELVKELTGGQEPNKSVNPDEVVAISVAGGRAQGRGQGRPAPRRDAAVAGHRDQGRHHDPPHPARTPPSRRSARRSSPRPTTTSRRCSSRSSRASARWRPTAIR